MDLADLDTDEFLGLTPTYIKYSFGAKESTSAKTSLLTHNRGSLDGIQGTHLEGDGYRHL